MLLVGLTGGIGAGKSTVARLLAVRGAVILDADAFARAALSEGTAALDRVVERFGDEVLEPSGQLDRTRLASIVFADESSRRDLEAIVHPEVRRMVADGVEANAEIDNVIVLVNPLLIEMGMQSDCDVVVLVSADEHTQVARSVARGMDPNDVRARIAAQLPPEEKSGFVDVVIENVGTLEELERKVDRLWDELRRRASVR